MTQPTELETLKIKEHNAAERVKAAAKAIKLSDENLVREFREARAAWIGASIDYGVYVVNDKVKKAAEKPPEEKKP